MRGAARRMRLAPLHPHTPATHDAFVLAPATMRRSAIHSRSISHPPY